MDAIIRPLDDDDVLYRYARRTWRGAGVDNFTQPPNENEDSFEILQNFVPPVQNVMQRRFGYATFVPKLDTGVGTGSDQIPSTALYGAQFDGEAGYVYTAKQVTWNYASPVVSIEFWFETFSAVGGYFVSLNESQLVTSSETQLVGIYMNASGQIGAGYYNGAAVELSSVSPKSYNDGVGHMVDVIINGTNITIYVDNVSVVSSTVTVGTGTQTGYWRLAEGPGGSGWDTNEDDFMQTFLSHVSIFPGVALTATQVNTHYTAMTSPTGTQAIYETTVLADKPAYYWFLTDTAGALPASQSVIVQNTTAAWEAPTGTGAQTIGLPLLVSANHIIVICVGSDYGAVTGITDSQSNSYSAIPAASYADYSANGLVAYYAETSAPGSLTITVATSTTFASNNYQAIIFELQNTVVPSPLDTSNVAVGQSVTATSGSVTTADEPDIILSFVVTDRVTTLVPGQGFVLSANNNTSDNRNSNTKTMAAAYTQTNTLGTYNCKWTNASSSLWIANTIALQLNLPSANAAGNTAFDSADKNTGTYTFDSLPNSVSTPSWTGSGTSTVTMTATASGPAGIQIGDTGFLILQAAPSTLTVTGVTDANGNTWTQLTPSGFAYDTTRIFSIWAASMQTAIAAAGTMVITATLSGNCSAIQGSFFNVPDLETIITSAHATGNSTTPASGGLTTLTSASLLAFATGDNAITGYPSSPWSGTPFLLVSASNGYSADYIYSLPPGTFMDTWTMSSGQWADYWGVHYHCWIFSRSIHRGRIMPATIQAENLYSYQNDALGVRTILGCAVDGSGLASISNVAGYWDASGNFQTIFTPSV